MGNALAYFGGTDKADFFQHRTAELGDAAKDACQLVHQPLQQLRRQPVDLQRAHQVFPTSQSQAL